jgi:AcrR family transcriptional regulator
VTVREVCQAAHANVAAINYHFGDKFGLYREIIQEGIAIMRESNRLGEEAGRGQPADERLRAFLRVFLARVADAGEKGHWLAQVMAREMEDPTPAMELVVQQVIEPRLAYMGEAIAELLRCPVTDPRVRRCLVSIQ